jgi:hypothetical protein
VGYRGLRLGIGDGNEERAASACGAADLHAAAQQLDALADAQQAEPGAARECLRVESPSLVGDGHPDASPHAPQSQAGLFGLGVLDHVEQHLLGRTVKERSQCVGMRLDPTVGLDVNGQAVLGLHLLSQPFKRLAQIALVEHRRAQLVRQTARLVDRLAEHLADLAGDLPGGFVVLDAVAQDAQMKLRGRQHLL